MAALSVPLNQFDNIQTVLELPTKQGPASLPVPNPTPSFWIDTPGANPLAKEGSEGLLTEDADICIIGSGITGISAAYHLSKSFAATNSINAPVKAVILEARDFCSGATGRNGGHLTPAVFLDFCKLEAGYGQQQALRSFALESYTASEIVKILDTEKLGNAVDLVSGSHVTMFVTEKEVKEAKADFAAAKAAGFNLDDVEWLSKEEMETIYGTSYPAYRFPGRNLWPLKLVTELYNLARRKTSNFSLNIHTRTPVTSITPISHNSSNPSRRWTMNTPRGSISCSYIIHATNAYASHLLPHMHGPSGIIPTRGQIIALRAAATLSELSKTSWDGNEGFEYWFPRPVNKSEGTGTEKNPLVIMGGGREAAEPPFEYYQTDDSVTNKDVGKALKDFLPDVFPGKFEKGREPEMEWTGIMGYTKLRDPFVGPVIDKSQSDEEHFKGQYVSAGYTGHGMPRAFACAEVVAKMIVAELVGEKWTTPEWLPERYLTWARDGESAFQTLWL